MHRPWRFLTLALTGLGMAALALLGTDPVAAQGVGLVFGRPAHRPLRDLRRRPPRNALVVPLPVPRPRFPADTAAKPPSTAATPSATAGAARPSATPATPPVMRDVPERPGDRDGGAGDATKTTEAPGASSRAPSPDPAKPDVAPSGADAVFKPRQPPFDDACPGRLAAGHVGTEAVAIGPQPDARCTVVQPVRLSDMTLPDGLKVNFPDHPTIACDTADTFARYVRELLVPLARGSYGSAVDAVWTGPGLECRARDHVRGAKLSAHGQGLAIDIAQLALADGRRIEVGAPRTATDQAFETAARTAACGYFHTTLGPGSDSYHRNHWHFDLEQRGRAGDTKYCK